MVADEYNCQTCGAAFDNAADLMEHNRSQHSEYKCEVCARTLESQDELDAHMRSLHPDRETTPEN